MKTIEIRALRGPNVFCHCPVLVLTLDLEDYAERDSTTFPGLTERLLATLPGLYEHRCSRLRRGGFVERLQEGTYVGHIVEHVALELSGLAGPSSSFGKTVYGGAPGMYDIAVEYEEGGSIMSVGRIAIFLQGLTFPRMLVK